SIDKMQENGLEFSEAMKHDGFQDGGKILTVDSKHQPRADWMVVDILLAEQIIVDRNGKEVPININDGGVKAILNGAKAQGLYFPSPKDIVIDSLVPNGNAIKAGLQKDDKIVGVNNSSLNNFSQLKQTLESHKNDSILVDIIRNGQRLSLPVKVTDSASLGFGRKGVDKAFLGSLEVTRKYGILEAIPAGLNKTFTNLAYQIKQFKLIIRPKTEAYKQISGPLRLFKVFDPEWDWTRFWNFTAMFSIWLAFINLL